jgi:hypothetical protein
METLDKVEYLRARIAELEESTAVEPEANGHPYKERQERARQQQARLIIRGLQLERTRTLREAWRNWHERRVFLHRQIRVFEGLAQERRDELQRLYTQKPPLIPGYEPRSKNGRAKERDMAG